MNPERKIIMACRAGRGIGFVLFAALFLSGCLKLASAILGVSSGDRTPITVHKNVMVPMRDGVKLATDVYLPGDGAYPVVLTRIPYGTDVFLYEEVAKLFVRNGYAFVAQDTRGEFDSEGEWFPLIYEYEDGHDTTAWIMKQPWCNGKIGMWGGSYFGYTQLQAAPDNPDLACMVPWVTSGNMLDIIFRGGASEFFSWKSWLAAERINQLKRKGLPGKVEADFSGGYFNEPIRDARPLDFEKARKDPALLAAGPEALLVHPGDVQDLPPLNYSAYYAKVSAPAQLVAGWYDIFLGPQLNDFVRLRNEGRGHAKKVKIIIGPWVHGMFSSRLEKDPLSGFQMVGSSFMSWYDYWLKGVANGAADTAPVKIFIMGENVWRDEQEWPLARTQYTKVFLQSRGNANTDRGDGALSFDGPAGPADQYDYDPKHPVPTAGGNFLGSWPYKAGAQDQGGIPRRPDVLVYQSAPLEKPLEVTGPIKLILYAASSAKDTDWVAKFLDVGPRGKPRLLQEGIIRARYRNGYQHPSAIVPGEVYEYTIDLWATANLFLPGHRLALWITSSDFPQFDRNSNAAGEGGPDNIVIAHQSIHHDEKHPSHLLLPVIPR